MSAISPRSTLISCGSSSRLLRRSTRPTLVIRGSSRLVAHRESSAPPVRIVRNFRTQNGLPWSPVRRCVNRTGPGVSILMSTATIAISGDVPRRRTAAATHSQTALITHVRPEARPRRWASRFTIARRALPPSGMSRLPRSASSPGRSFYRSSKSVDHQLDVLHGEIGMERDRQCLGRCTLGDGKVTFPIAESVTVERLKVDRRKVRA